MIYSVTYRNPSTGSRDTLELDAPDRDALWTALKERGVNNVISVAEGRVRKTTVNARKANAGVIKGIVAGVIVVVAAVAAWFILAPSPETPVKNEAPKTKPKPVASAPAVAPKPVEPPKEVAPTNTPPKRYEDGVEVISSTITTNSSGAVIERLKLADGKSKMKVHPPKPVFNNPSDQVIALAISTKPGQSMPPLPALDKGLEQDFLNSLVNPIVINDDDSPEVKDLKARVKETKAYLVEEIKNGGSLLDALAEHQKLMQKYADDHLMAIQTMQELKASSGEEVAREFIERVNESFRERGEPEIELGSGASDSDSHRHGRQ